MKKLSFILIFIMLVGSLSSCGAREDRFELTYESDRTLYLVGETVKITAKVTNVSGRTYTYKGGSSDYRPYVRLYPILEDDKLGEPLEHLPIASTTDMPSKHKIADGKSGQVTFEFPLPEDAHIGKYTVSLSYEGAKKVFDGAISVVRPAEQNHVEGMPYSTVTVSSGEEDIHPLRGLLYTNQYLNGEPALCGDGYGVYWFFDSIYDINVENYPCLVLNGEITVTASENVQTGTPYLYDLDYERLEYNGGFEGLSALPAGEYLVVFTEYHDGSLDNPDADEYWKTMYENLFKLMVRS